MISPYCHPENKEEPTIYDDVKPKVPAATEPDGEAAASRSVFRVLAVFSVTLCVLLLASVGVIVYVSVVMNQQTATLSNLTAENQQLMTERSVLERETEELSRTAGNLNWTLGVIMKYDKFPVSEFCPEKKCQPCRTDWILFEGKCYLFSSEDLQWLTWNQSRKYCQGRAADLVVIDSLHEHEFISNHTKYYYDWAHGYWLGLYETVDKYWRWIDGHNDTLGYWIAREKLRGDGRYVLLLPGRRLTASWNKVGFMYNKFICESDTLTR
ncbi:C-type lectin domain family 4 member G-like isoform X2 [Sparus aurata]|uniref:C-type lectin domain family 4 member G-like isoform X2 n=1 Tax=Sparus aurata TaxID=8175 RepID=UPI0011C19F40|nr:C-type lectin domain family 4 member G-like isoform X2 [Sparus aurata]